MLSLKIKILDEKAGRPFGNPFHVRAVTEDEIGPTILDVGTGLVLDLPVELRLDVTPLRAGVVFLSYRFASSGELRLIVQHDGSLVGTDDVLASVYIAERNLVPVRFVEVKDGKRVVAGAPMDTKLQD